MLIFICSGVIFGQEIGKNNFYSGLGFNFFRPYGCNIEYFLSYERSIIPQLSFSVNVAGQYYPLALIFILVQYDLNSVFGYLVDTQIKYYPY